MKRHINVKHQYIYIYLDTCITNISYILIYVHGNFKKTYTTYIEIAVGNSYHKCKCFTIYKPNPAAPSNGNSSWYMKRKASNFQDDFDKCVGIAGVSDSNLRKILSRLHKEKEPSSKSRTVTKRFPDLHKCLQAHDVDGATIYIVDLQKYLDRACMQPAMQSLLREVSRDPEGCPGLLYLDEAVPGNVISPDQRRKSWCVFFAWLDMAKRRHTLFWLPLAVVRHDVAAEIEGGVARMFSVILQATLPFFRGYIWGDTLIYTTMLYFLADEAALKMASDAKGSSGFKPCIKCNNCVARGNALDGFYSIEEDDFLNFVNAPDPDVIQIQQHLARLSEESTKARLREAEKLSGWNLNRSSWMWSPDLWALLKPSCFIYDSMHVMWSNGICNQELGYFFSAACSKADLKRSHLEEFMKANWERSMNIGSELAPSSLPSLVSSKLLKSDWQDYRGDATQTLMLMPLMTYFATACMGGHESLQAEIESLVALNAIAHKLLAAKINPQKAQGLIALQQRHLQSFREAYGPSYIRPKHHYGFHIEEQVVSLGLLTDCFPTERKNKKFKSYLAPMVKRLEDFEQSILLRWMEQDLMELQNLDLTSGLEGTSVQEGGYTFSSCLRHGLLKIKADNLLFFEEADAACLVVCAIKHKETLKVIARSLCLDEHGPNKCWSTWTMEDKYVSVPLPEAMNATRTSFHSICDRKVVMLR